MRFSANPLSRPPEISSKSKSSPISTATDDTPTSATKAARRVWANNLKSEWERRGAHEEEYSLDLPTGPPPPAPSPAGFCTSYPPPPPVESFSLVFLRHVAMPRRCVGTTSIWRSSTGKGELREPRARRERRLPPARRLKRSASVWTSRDARPRKKNGEQVIVAAWARYERGWMDLLSGVIADGRQPTFYDIPWHVAMPARSFDELQASSIERFLLSPYHSTTKARKMQWHPDSHVTPNLPVGKGSNNQPESSAAPHVPVYPPHVRRTSDGIRAMQSPSTRRPFSPPSRHALSPPQRTPSERIIVAVTHDAENYVVVDITGQTDAQAIRERIPSKLHIPDDLHPSFAIYLTELGGFAIGGALDNNQLLNDCQHFGDDRGSLKFLAQRADAPTDDVDIPVMPPSNASVPPLLPSLSTFSPGAMRIPPCPVAPETPHLPAIVPPST
ncbi:hypothetical protein FRC08_000614 [Ceratobasidium sp. 394]|nr:hypothetical protein FRC08_000614 [Ceratobasidium sp. 394]